MSEQIKRMSIDPSAKLHRLRQKRHNNGRELKVVITQRDSETGGGKTTLAVWLALNWDPEWDGEARGTVSAEEFLAIYPELPEDSVLVMDEAEELDARRSMASENIEFSKHWMMMRTRQVDSILTLPTTSALDSRLLELADIRINVTRRGKANVYRIKVDDHHPEPEEWFLHEIEWPDVSAHPEYERLDAQKQTKIDTERGQSDEGDAEQTAKEIADEIRDAGALDTYIETANGGATRWLDADRIAAEFEVNGAKGKRVKSLLKEDVADDVM